MVFRLLIHIAKLLSRKILPNYLPCCFIDFLERERNINSLVYLFMHLLTLACPLTRNRTCSLGVSGRCSSQMSHRASAYFTFC